MFLTCSGVRGDLGRTPGLEGAVCGGGVEGRSVILAVDRSDALECCYENILAED